MAHFYGTIKGTRGQASRLGGKASGLRVKAMSWQGAVEVSLIHDEQTGKDIAYVTLNYHPGNGAGTRKVLYDGPVGG